MKYNAALMWMIFSLITIPNFIHSAEPQTPQKFTELLRQEQRLGNTYQVALKNQLQEWTEQAQRPHETLVPMWGQKCIKMQPTNNPPRTLAANTAGVGPTLCMAALLLVQYNNGNQYATMTNYHTLSRFKHYIEIEKSCEEIISTNENEKIKSINFFVTMPIDSTSPQLAIEELDHLNYAVLQKLVSSQLGIITPVKMLLIPYNNHKPFLFTLEAPRDFEVTLHPDKATVIANSGNQCIELPL